MLNITNKLEGRSLTEICEAAELERERISKEIYVDNHLVIFNCGYEYWIDLRRLNSPEKLLAWVSHIADKPWMTPVRLKHFIRLVADRYKMKVSLSTI